MSGIEISEQEAELYDRQIRLWGLEAQRRLRNARLLMIGVTSLSAEIAKNIVLAGINSLTLVDDAALSSEEAEASFVFDSAAVGQSRAAAALPSVQEFNPMVTVSAAAGGSSSIGAAKLSGVDALVACGQTVSELLRLDSLCRQIGVQFFAADCFGFYGYVFVDLQRHEYVVEQPPAPKQQQQQKQQQDKAEPELQKKVAEYPSLESVLAMRWDPKQLGSLRRIPAALFLTFLIFEFERRHIRRPRAEDAELLVSLWKDFAEEKQLPVAQLDEAALSQHMHASLCPVAAIVGGVAAQEIIKAVSRKDDPFKNFFTFDGLQSCGAVQSLCAQ